MSLTASASDANKDISADVVASMRRMGVVGLPRNYEIIYEVMKGSNKALCEEFARLGAHPTQEALDELSRKYFAQNDQQAILEAAQEQVSLSAEEIFNLVGRERASLEKFGTVLDQTSTGLKRRSDFSRELLQKLVRIVVAASETTLEHSRQISTAMREKTAELEQVKASLEEYKRLADTDPLTGIWNRRAFDRKLGSIYTERRSIIFHALILIDVDEFKVFNDRYGHPAGDRILQKIAPLIEARCGETSFVARTGGEEFAVVLDGLSEEAAETLAEELRVAVNQADFMFSPQAHHFGSITISLGLCMASDAASADELYAMADRALYDAKMLGRDRISCFSKLSGGKFSKDWLLYRGD